MKKLILHIVTTLSLCLMLGVAVNAQSTREMTITIPFDFHVGKKVLPAGTYTVYKTSAHSGDGFLLRDKDGDVQIYIHTQQVQTSEVQSHSRLEFRRYSDKYFLARFWSAGNNIGRVLQKSRLEREAAKDDARHLTQTDVRSEIVTVAIQ
jgi:hypothetical protein